MNAIQTPSILPSELQRRLLAQARPRRNSLYLVWILGSQRDQKSCLPSTLGLTPLAFEALLNFHFEHPASLGLSLSDSSPQDHLRAELLALRHDEQQVLRQLILRHRRGHDPSEEWMADIVAAACLGGRHLWRDLGLASRDMLKGLIRANFPELIVRNSGDMRWKKFLYRLLCDEQGGYSCPAPSCQSCTHHADCFEAVG